MTGETPTAETIFYQALELNDEARARFVRDACRDAPQVRCEVEQLLADYTLAQGFLEQPAAVVAPTIDLPPLERPGTQIGPYKLLEQIGEGGMGIVYVASQKEPLRRQVALKIIKPGMDTREVVARFEAERQALALMDHPNIAKVFDAGATDAGRPYFAMELVKGTPITEYCDREQLSTRERLALFVTLCHGVQHAHQKGVIHRDLKPSNLLIEVDDVRPVPKIIDFGIAKAVGQQLTEKTFYTAQSQIMGTPLYMSPEQAGQSCRDVDTRSDIYSLGVVLYKLLTGATPFEKDALHTVDVDEMRRIIREVEPPRPSARVSTLQAADLSTVCDRRQVEPHKLRQELRGDLDWIVMKTLDKDRDRRYESASALAADVQRYLDNEPVQARPPSWSHHAAKWVRRHRPLVGSSAAVLAIAALVGGALFWTSYRRAAQLERDAGEHLAAATAFLGSGNYTAADRELADVRGRLESAGYREGPLQENVTDLSTAIAAKTQSVGDFAQFQELRHRIHSEMYALDRDILDQAQTHCRTALDLFGVFEAEPWKSQADFEHLDPAHQSLLDEGAVELLFIWARLEMGKSDSPQPATERAAGYGRAIEALVKIESFHPLIPAVALWMADCWEAIGDQSAATAARLRAESLRPTSATDYYLLGEYHAQRGQQDQALASYWQALTQQPDHYLSLLAAGVTLGELQKYESAETMLTGAIAMNPHAVIAYLKRATARAAQDKIVLAQADIQEAKKRDPELARVLLRRADEFQWNFQLDKARADYDEVIRLDPQADAYRGRGINYLFQGDLEKALADANENIRLAPGSAEAYSLRGEIYRMKGDFERALADANEALRLDPQQAWTYQRRGRIYEQQSEWDKALADMKEAVHLKPNDAGLLVGRADIYRAIGEREKARADFQEALRLDPKNVWACFGLGFFYRECKDFDKALTALNEAVRIAPQYYLTRVSRAEVHRDRGDFEKALADYNEAIRLAPHDVGAYATRAAFYRDRGDFEKALADYNEAIRLNPHDVGAYTARAAFYRNRGDFEKALADSNEAIRLNPNNASGYGSRADTYRAMGLLDKGLADMNEGMRLDPKNPGGYGHRGHFHRDLGDFDKALADYSEAIRLSPRFVMAYVARASLHSDRGDFEKALADYNEAIRRAPANGLGYAERGTFYLDRCEFEKAAADFDRTAELGPISWHFYKRAGLAHFRLQHYDKALESIAKAVELNPGDGSNLWWIPLAQVAKCPDERLRQGLLELADKSIEKSPGKAETYAARAMLFDAFGRDDEARIDFDKALELDPKYAGLYKWRAAVHANHARWSEVVADLSKCIEANPDQAGFWLQRSVARLGGGQADEYRQDCSEMLQRFGSTAKVSDGSLVAWACALAPNAVTDWATAIALAEKAVQSNPKFVLYINTLGAVLYRAGRFDEALARLAEAAALVQEPSEANAGSPAYTWFFLAMAHHRLGHAEEAKQWLDKAVAWTDKTFAEADQGTVDLAWNRRLTLKLLRDEATALLDAIPPTVEPAPEAAKEEEKSQ